MLKLFSFKVVLFTLITVASRVLLAQISFEKTYGGSLDEWGGSVQQTTDGGYIIVGATGSSGIGEYDIFLIKTNSNGDTLWTKTFGSAYYDIGHAVQQTSDGGYIIAGSKFRDAYLIKTNSEGDTLWTKSYDYGFYSWFCNDVQQTTDGGYVIAGGVNMIFDLSPFLAKTDAYGDILWFKMDYPIWRSSYISSVQQTTDGGYILTDSYSIIKTDSNGDTLWTKSYINPTGDSSFFNYSVQQTTDGGYIIAGFKNTTNSNSVSIIKTNSFGDTLWTKAYDYWNGYDCYGYSVKQTSDSGYIVSGGISTNQYYHEAFLIKTDSAGDTLWTKTFGEGEYGAGYSVHQTNDGGYVFVGTTYEYSDSSDIYLIKTLPDGTVVPVELMLFTAIADGKEVILKWSTSSELNNLGFEIQRSVNGKEYFSVGFASGHGTTSEQQNYIFADKNLDNGNYYYRLKQVDYNGSYEYSDVVEVEWRAFNSYLLEQNFPNPFNPTTTIGFGLQNKSNVKITILNAIGEEVAIVLNEEREAGYDQLEFNANNLPSGVYFYRLQAGSFIETKKMLLLK